MPGRERGNEASGGGPAGTTVLMVAAVVAGLALGGFALRWLDDGAAPDIVIEDARADATIVVAVEGAVANPGVYALGPDARMQDALARAGGLAPGADLAAVNPAQRLQDEERIVVPRLPATQGPVAPVAGASAGEGDAARSSNTTATATAITRAVVPTATSSAAGRSSAVGGEARAPIDINVASAAELEGLPGVGPTLAERIVAYRDANGPFASVDGLEGVQGISARMVEEMRSLVTVGL